jgi:hypothetical protein
MPQIGGSRRYSATKNHVLSLSRNWEMLAIQLEDAFAKRAENEAIRLNVRESLQREQTSFGFAHLEKNFQTYTTFDRSGAPRIALGSLNASAGNRR